MIGTLINIAAILVGGIIGLLFGGRINARIKATIIAGMGLFTAVIGIKMFLDTQNSLIVLGSLIIGGLLGEWWKIEDGLNRLSEWLERRFNSSIGGTDRTNASANFVRGFMVTSLLFCIGPIAILGSIQAGMSADYNLLVIKSVLDGFASLAFASTLGVGVLFSAASVLLYQGAITLLASQLSALVTEQMMAELNAAGGVLLLGLAISSLLEIKKIRIGNFLPALLIAPLIVLLINLF
jgi:uncharacterized membrane protein YqgA involved in biofilm formation